MQLVTPGIGLIFWMLVSFSLVMLILKAFAWTPIMKGIHQREETIEKALEAANEAKKEMLQISNGFLGVPFSVISKDDGTNETIIGFDKGKIDQILQLNIK